MKFATGNILNQQASTGGDNIYLAFIDLIVLVYRSQKKAYSYMKNEGKFIIYTKTRTQNVYFS